MSTLLFVFLLWISMVMLRRIHPQNPLSDEPTVERNEFQALKREGYQKQYRIYEDLQKLSGYNRFLANVRVKLGNGQMTTIDLILISKKGIYVFQHIELHGMIYGDERYKKWTAVERDRTKHAFPNPIWHGKQEILALKPIILLYESILYKSMIVFSEYSHFSRMESTRKGVHICRKQELLLHIREEMLGAKDVLSKEKIDTIYEQLKPYMHKTRKHSNVKPIKPFTLIKGKKE